MSTALIAPRITRNPAFFVSSGNKDTTGRASILVNSTHPSDHVLVHPFHVHHAQSARSCLTGYISSTFVENSSSPSVTERVRVRALSHLEIKIDVWKYIRTIIIGQYAVCGHLLDNHNRAHSPRI